MKKKDLPDINVLKAIFEGMEDAVLSYDLHHKIVYWNVAAEEMFGFSPDEMSRDDMNSLVPESLKQEQLAVFEKVSAGEKVGNIRTQRVAKRGHVIPVSLTASPVRDLHGNVVGVTHIVRNISRQNQIEERQGMLTAIIDNSDDAIISTTLDGFITSWNKGAEVIFDYLAEEIIGQHVAVLIPEERRSDEEIIADKIRKGDKVHHFDTMRRTKDGHIIPISLTESAIKDGNGAVIGISKIARNISSQRIAEEKQAILASIVENSDDAIISKTLEGIITTWNSGAERIFGYTAGRVIGRHISILIPPDRLNEETTIIESIRRGDKIDHFQTVRLHKNGMKIDISLTVSPVKDSSGTIIGASKIARDITRQEKALEAVRHNAERLEVLHSVGKAISEKLDVELILKKVVEATTLITGAGYGLFFYKEMNGQGETKMLFAASGISGAAYASFKGVSPDCLKRIFRSGRVIRTDDMCKDAGYLARRSDFIVPPDYPLVMSYLRVPLISGNGTVSGGLFFGHPLPGMFTTEHEHLVASLASQASVALENSRLFEEVTRLSRRKDEFIALASHELKTPVTTLSGFLQLLKEEVSEESAGVFVEKALAQLDKLATLINDLLDVSKIRAGKLQFRVEEFDLVEFMKEIVETYGNSISSHQIRYTRQGRYMIAADKIRLEQVMANLINNAVKYSPDADAIDIYVKEQANEIAVSVKDYGFGISKENIRDIFSPFYRAENVSRKVAGLGLGLFVSKEIIERHGGRIWIESKPGEGSVFTFTVPFSGS